MTSSLSCVPAVVHRDSRCRERRTTPAMEQQQLKFKVKVMVMGEIRDDAQQQQLTNTCSNAMDQQQQLKDVGEESGHARWTDKVVKDELVHWKMRKLTDCIFVGISALVHVDVIFTRINALVHVDIIDIIFIGTDSSRLLCRAGDAACFELLLLLPTSSPPGGDLDQVGRLSAAVPGAAWEGAAIWTWGCQSEAVPPPASSTSI
ncbi:uncharacterized protein [Triticum aestivum]|uniref:uncharacterized protein isoform X3 n=1 Tax=Triticum aestivum TaxID=4565 RepID=UPI001D02D074|nr:uncharacterized protein LOC123080702 isoform X3 [Triticum aestivum]